MKTECISGRRISLAGQMPLDLAFDAPEMSSDGGAILLRQMDEKIGLGEWFSACLPDVRQIDRVRHTRLEQVRQRIYQIAQGYEDANDADTLRHDRAFQVACGRSPGDEEGLSSQPTLSRLENVVSARSLKRLMDEFERSYVESLPVDTELVMLDIDSTDDRTHGRQQLAFFHGFYDTHMYHPLLIFDGAGQLVTVLLRPGNSHAARGAAGVLERLIRRIKARFPDAQIVVRGDAGFAMPHLMARLEGLDEIFGDIKYVFGIARNPRLVDFAGPALEEAMKRFVRRRRTVKLYDEFSYAAESWPHERRVVVKAEWMAEGRNPRFVVTSIRGFPPEMIYRAYVQRGQSENYIKDLKNALRADRLSCSKFTANAFRLFLHAAAYRLLWALRNTVAQVSPALGKVQFDTLRLKLLKVGAWVSRSVRRVLIRLPKSFPLADVFRDVAAALDPPPLPA